MEAREIDALPSSFSFAVPRWLVYVPGLMPTLRPLRFATVLAIGFAFCALTCGGGDNLVDQVCPSSPQRLLSSPAMTTMEFCQVYMQTCKGAQSPQGGYITEAECQAAYTGLTFDSTRECRSYHICNAASYDKGNALVHCGHSVGLSLCPDTGP